MEFNGNKLSKVCFYSLIICMLLRQSRKGVTVTRILFWNSGTLTRASRVSSTSMTRQPFPAPPPTHQQAVKDPLKFLILAPARNTDWRERGEEVGRWQKGLIGLGLFQSATY